MALQSSGSISISQIKSEVGGSSSSLRSLSNAAGKSAPDSMQEFYGYSHVTLTSYTSSIPSNATIFTVCNESPTATYYHDGITPYPVTNNKVYTSSAGGSSNYVPAGYYKIDDGSSGLYIQVNNSGSVTLDDICF
jgi:hypothetical protein